MGTVRIESFSYPAGPEPAPPSCEGWGGSAALDQHPSPAAMAHSAEAARKSALELEKRIAEERLKAFEQGRQRGREEGGTAEREALAAAREALERQRIEQSANWLEALAAERDRYLHAVEHEVVRLALAVAARILRREAQMDPLLLTGAVRVALGQLSATTRARLFVPSAELDLWREAMAHLPNLAIQLQVAAGEGMLLGDCRVETDLGSVDLGVRAQLSEIERGFFDRAGTASRETTPGKPLAEKSA